MKHIWTAAAIAALLGASVSTGASAATHRHKKADVDASDSGSSSHGKSHGRHAAAARQGTPHSSKSRKGRHASEVAKSDEASGDEPTHGRHGRLRGAAEARSGGAIKTETPEPVTVAKGDTLYNLSRKTGVDRDTIARLNGLKPPYHLKPGQEIKLPSRRYYAVKHGDTLSAVAKKVDASPVSIAAFNETGMSEHLRAGEKIYLPDEAHDTTPPVKTARSESRRHGASKAEAAAESAAAEAPRATPSVRTAHNRRAAPSETTTTKSAPGPTQYAAAQPQTAPASDQGGLDASLGLTAHPATGNPARAAAATPPASRPAVTRPQRPTYSPPPVTTSSGFQMVPETKTETRMAANVPPAGGVPYSELSGSSTPARGHDRYGRPTSLPPGVAVEAPSSQPPLLEVSPPPTQADIVAAGRGRFVWPVHGAVLSGFGPKTDGQRNDGLNIAAQPGEAVRAAAAGQVVYAGDQVPSFGNLVLVKHPNGWVTAYAHMSGITVKNQEQVAQGQQIGIAGSTGNVAGTQLHFETRYAASVKDKAAPVDPMLVLPGQ